MGIRSLVFGRRSTERECASWAEACTASGTGYDAEMLTKFRIARSARRVPDGGLLNGSVLNLVARMIGKPDISVTDFGGAAGDLGVEFLTAFPEARYTVVETPGIVNMARRLGRRVAFTTETPDNCDIFFTSGTLQSIATPFDVLGIGLATARTAAILVRNCFSDTERYHVQRSRLFDNGVGPIPDGWEDIEVTYPHRTLRESDVLTTAAKQGFSCISRLEEHSGAIFGCYGWQLVFWRDQLSIKA